MIHHQKYNIPAPLKALRHIVFKLFAHNTSFSGLLSVDYGYREILSLDFSRFSKIKTKSMEKKKETSFKNWLPKNKLA